MFPIIIFLLCASDYQCRYEDGDRIKPHWNTLKKRYLKNGDIPADKYRLYKPGSVVLTPGVRAYLSENAAFFQNVGMFFDSARPDDEWEIWFSMKFTGPQFSESKYQENKVFCDRIILVRQESGKGKRLERKKAERNQADIEIYPVRSAVNQKNTAEDPLAEKGWAVWEP